MMSLGNIKNRLLTSFVLLFFNTHISLLLSKQPCDNSSIYLTSTSSFLWLQLETYAHIFLSLYNSQYAWGSYNKKCCNNTIIQLKHFFLLLSLPLEGSFCNIHILFIRLLCIILRCTHITYILTDIQLKNFFYWLFIQMVIFVHFLVCSFAEKEMSLFIIVRKEVECYRKIFRES